MAEGVDLAARHKRLAGHRNEVDVVCDLRGSRYLLPKDRDLVESRKPASRSFEVSKPKADPDVLPPWWWNPGNPMAASLPASVSFGRYQRLRKALQAIDKAIDITWNGADKIWQLWYFKPGFTKTSPWTHGWVHVKDFKPWQGTPYILKMVAAMDSNAVGSVKKRYQKVVAWREAQRAKQRKDRLDKDRYLAGQAYDHTQISTAGRGNKFVNFHM